MCFWMGPAYQLPRFFSWSRPVEDSERSGGLLKLPLSIQAHDKLNPPSSGCSRDEFNGDYVQKAGEFYYRRPIFYNAEGDKYLFYHAKRPGN